ncbi:MAG: low temperature requirement protein A [Nocardioides sp.]
MDTSESAGRPTGAARRHAPTFRGEEARVTPLELFFDLIFVLALTQCTAFMASDLSWLGIGKGLLILAMLWWAWVGYAWLTSVVDPEEGEVRIAIFVSMAAMLVAALAVPLAFGADALVFAVAYAVVRLGQVALFLFASGDDPHLRRSVLGLAMSSALGVGPLIAAAFADGWVQLGLWLLAFVVDYAGPLVINASGWRLSAEHFAERHNLIIIIALGESIVAIGVGSERGVDAAVIVAAVLGTAIAACLWWVYFDVVALVSTRRLQQATPGLEQSTMARDSFSYLHFPMVAGVVLVALGLKKVLGEPFEELYVESAAALFGGAAAYLVALSAFRRRNMGQFNRPRLWVAALLIALIPAATRVPALGTMAFLAAVMIGFVCYEVIVHREGRTRIRTELRH